MRRFVAILSAVAITATLAACSSQSTPAGNQAAGAKKEEVTLNVLVRSSTLFNQIEKMTPAFTEKTGIKVVYTKLPEDQLYDRIALVSAGSDNPFDLTATGHFGAKQYGKAGFFEPLPMPEDKDAFIPSTISAWKVGDQLYGWPLVTDTNVYFYRKDLFAKYNISGPAKTWDEFREIARKLTIDKNGKNSTEPGFDPNNVAVWGAIFKGAQNSASSGEWFNWLQQADGQIVDKDYNVTVNKGGAVRSLEFLTDLIHKDKVMPISVTGFGYNEFVDFWVKGNAAQAVNWVYMYGSSNDPKSSTVVDKVGIATLPKDAKYSSMIGGWSWNVFKSSKHKEAAMEYVKYFTSEETGWTLATEIDSAPVRTALFERLIKEEGEPWTTLNEQLKVAEAQYHLETGQSVAIEREVQKAIQESFQGRIKPQEALDAAAVEIEKILKDAGVK